VELGGQPESKSCSIQRVEAAKIGNCRAFFFFLLALK
jgi:hypothetical protein